MTKKITHEINASLKLVWQHCKLTVLDAKPVLIMLALSFISAMVSAQEKKLWPYAGQNQFNTHNAAGEHKISPTTAASLSKKWEFTTGGDVSATPAVDEEFLYFPDWAGNLYKLDAKTGVQVWKTQIKDYTGQIFGFARATPALAGNTIIIGTQMGNPTIGAWVLGINKMNGNLIWKTQVESHFASIVTQSAMINGNRAYVGVASQEEGIAADPNYPCCSFRGSMLCLDVKTGAIVWKTYMAPNVTVAAGDKGFTGNAIWGSTPVIDEKRNSVYVTTGNNYTVPQAILDCAGSGGTSDQIRACVAAVNGSTQNFFDAIVSMDLNTGAIKWAKSVMPFDAWTVACFFAGPNCPDNAGPDYDFGQGPALFSIKTSSGKQDVLGAGQKSGIYWLVNPDDGNEIWHTQVGPGSTLGGLQWGSAVDDKQIYTAVSNYYYIPHLMTKGPGAGTTVAGGFFAALDPATGAVNWENAGTTPPAIGGQPGQVAANTGMVTVANDVVFGGALDAAGTMYAFNAKTGEKLWSFESGGSINSGAAVVDGTVYWGSGYSNFGLGTANNKMYAFSTDKKNAITSARPVAPAALKTGVTVYPSPAKDVMKIASKDKSNIQSVRLFDLSGRLVKDFKTNSSPTYNLNLGLVPAGTYMIHVVTKTNTTTSQVVVTH